MGPSPIHEAFCRQNGLVLLKPVEAATLSGIAQLTHLSLQFPGEHCTECAAPDCHESCDLFQRGPAGLCRRFVDGIVFRRPGFGPFPYSMEVLFKNWGRLLCVGNTLCISRHWYYAVCLALPLLGRLGGLVQAACRFLPPRIHWHVSDKIRGASNRLPRLMNRLAARRWGTPANAIMCVVGNPSQEPVAIEVAVSGFGDSQNGRVWRQTEMVPHGWRVISIPTSAVAEAINMRTLFRVAIVPLIEKPTLLQIAYAGFVSLSEIPAVEADRAKGGQDRQTVPIPDVAGAKKIKALVVDLDNTLWDGIVLEDPEATYELKPGIRDVLLELDRRGILLSIASKNNPADVRPILERQGIWDLFLHPQIGWQAKSASIESAVRKLNIGMDTVAFIDDSEFERAEVGETLPSVRVYDAALFPRIAQRVEFNVPVTEESQGRRKLYLEEQDRNAEFEHSTRDYGEFLVSCRIRVILETPGGKSMERVQELVQRTNQLNFSGNRYTRQDLCRILEDQDVISVVMRSVDRFGSYGIIGFSVLKIEDRSIEMKDLMLSCRIQGKQIEHAFLSCLVDEAARNGFERVICNYHRTPRNAAAAKVFEEMAFKLESIHGSRETYVLECGTSPPRCFPATVVDEMKLRERLAAARR